MQKAPTNQEFSAWVAEMRDRMAGVNLTHLASASRISRTTLWRVRQGRTTPDYETYNAIVDGIEALDEAEREGPSQ